MKIVNAEKYFAGVALPICDSVEKMLTILFFMVEYHRYAKTVGNPSGMEVIRERAVVEALVGYSASQFSCCPG